MILSVPFLYGVTGLMIFAIGLHGFIRRAHFLRKALAFNIMSAGSFAFLVALANRNGDGMPDPVPHAMVLTGIVVSVSATAFALALTVRLFQLTGGADFESVLRSQEGCSPETENPEIKDSDFASGRQG